jgi:hypothetical protein
MSARNMLLAPISDSTTDYRIQTGKVEVIKMKLRNRAGMLVGISR